MRPKGQPATLGEIMGSAAKGGSVTLKDLPKIIGEDKVIDMPLNKVGRFRLMRALQQRFGNGFRNNPTARSLMDQFDEDIKFKDLLDNMRSIRVKGKNNG